MVTNSQLAFVISQKITDPNNVSLLHFAFIMNEFSVFLVHCKEIY